MKDAYKAIFLIVAGILLLLANLHIIDIAIHDLWPLAIIFAGVMSLQQWLSEKENTGHLFTAVLLLVIGLFFQILTATSWSYVEVFWPIFILAPGLAMLARSFASDGEDKGSRISAFILIGVASVFFILNSPFDEYWPLILIVVGIVILFQSKRLINDDQTTVDNSQ